MDGIHDHISYGAKKQVHYTSVSVSHIYLGYIYIQIQTLDTDTHEDIQNNFFGDCIESDFTNCNDTCVIKTEFKLN